MPDREDIIIKMQNLVKRWEKSSDKRWVFLNCYMLMTRNVFLAISAGEFHHPQWIMELLHRFADYYFDALDAYDTETTLAPSVWQIAHNATRRPETVALQNLFLGVNAHINYDLVLTLVDMLDPEWHRLSESELEMRYSDHCHINDIIARTVDTVQDQVVERESPALDILDKALGPLDEWVVSLLITRWRKEVWQNAVALLKTSDSHAREHLRLEIEKATLKRAESILFIDGSF